MRIEPEQQAAARLRLATNTRQEDRGFAATLAVVRDGATGDAASGHIAPRTDEPKVPPPAERWGEYGLGATVAGYGSPPDPALFAHHAVGETEPAHPLNPRGNTTTPAFTVAGFTGRGTPIPPGFYNLAYYNRYLAEGGTPIEGFPGYTPEAGTLTDVYGAFGDGKARATSFPLAIAAAAEPVEPPAAPATAPAVAAEPSAPAPVAATGDAGRVAASAGAAEPALASAPATEAPAAEVVLAATLRAARLSLQALLDDLLRA